MKLIIDIPDEAYKDEKMSLYFGCYSRKLHSTLYNGIPLDKIKTEIEQIEINGKLRDVECFNAGMNTALNVIDKYIAKSEDK